MENSGKRKSSILKALNSNLPECSEFLDLEFMDNSCNGELSISFSFSHEVLPLFFKPVCHVQSAHL